MGVRMMCTDCLVTDEPDTLIDGSDSIELVLWCFLLVPGLIYCYWRHASRQKVCLHCGSGNLIREARAARMAREQREQAAAPPTRTTLQAAAGQGLLGRRGGTPRSRLQRARRIGTAFAACFGIVALFAVNAIYVRPLAERKPAAVPYAGSQVATPGVQALGTPAPAAAGRPDHQCEALCSELHGARPIQVRICAESCLARMDQEPWRLTLTDSCGGLLDPKRCGIFSSGLSWLER